MNDLYFKDTFKRWKEMRASPYMKYVSSPRLHMQVGTVCADLHTEAPHFSDLTVHCSAWAAASQSAALLVHFGIKRHRQRLSG